MPSPATPSPRPFLNRDGDRSGAEDRFLPVAGNSGATNLADFCEQRRDGTDRARRYLGRWIRSDHLSNVLV
jgi:hypothetical protein